MAAGGGAVLPGATAMKAGTLRHRLTLERKATWTDAMGARHSDWKVTAQHWGRVRALSNREVEGGAAPGISTETDYEATLRWPVELAPGDRLRFRGTILDVLSIVDAQERRRSVTVLCREVL